MVPVLIKFELVLSPGGGWQASHVVVFALCVHGSTHRIPHGRLKRLQAEELRCGGARFSRRGLVASFCALFRRRLPALTLDCSRRLWKLEDHIYCNTCASLLKGINIHI